ncbi:rCG44524 [Rattus norvegicus]|uniref:RCG44524 n=1 Tax=Rattus norvegicus TaxID=10116 RepID=A6I4W4_RAT|nr:rCG44524 [Rattus norvegicus]
MAVSLAVTSPTSLCSWSMLELDGTKPDRCHGSDELSVFRFELNCDH